MKFVSDAIKQTRVVRATFKIFSILFGLVALSPLVFGFVSNFLPGDQRAFSNAYLLNMSHLLPSVFAAAFTFVALDYLLKPRVRDLKEILSFEQKPEVVSALIGAYTRNLRNSSIFLLVASAGFLSSTLTQLTMAIQYASLGISGNGGPASEVYFLQAFQPLLTATVLGLLALFLLGQAKGLRSGLTKLETPDIRLN